MLDASCEHYDENSKKNKLIYDAHWLQSKSHLHNYLFAMLIITQTLFIII